MLETKNNTPINGEKTFASPRTKPKNKQTLWLKSVLILLVSAVLVFLLVSVFTASFSNHDQAKFEKLLEKLANEESLSSDEKSEFCHLLVKLQAISAQQNCDDILASYQKRFEKWDSSDLNDKIKLLEKLPLISNTDSVLLIDLKSEPDKKGANVNFDDIEKLVSDFGAKDLNDYHNRIKPKLREKFGKMAAKYFKEPDKKRINPDFRKSKKGFVLMKSTITGKTINTGEKI